MDSRLQGFIKAMVSAGKKHKWLIYPIVALLLTMGAAYEGINATKGFVSSKVNHIKELFPKKRIYRQAIKRLDLIKFKDKLLADAPKIAEKFVCMLKQITRQRVMAGVLSACLIFGLFPTSVFADTADSDVISGTDTCVCATLCTESAANADCPICGKPQADLTLCLGTPATTEQEQEQEQPPIQESDPATEPSAPLDENTAESEAEAVAKNTGNVATIGNAAYPSLSDAVSAATSGQKITLIADDNTTQSIEISQSLSIELDGHNLPNTTFKLTDGNVSISDSKGTGVINSNATKGFNATEHSRCYASLYITGPAQVTLNNLRIQASSKSDLDKSIFFGGSGTLTINGGRYIGPKEAGCDALFFFNDNNAVLTINDGHFEANCGLSVNSNPNTQNLRIKKARFVGSGVAFWIEGGGGAVTSFETAKKFLDESVSHIVGTFNKENILIGSGLFVSDGFTDPENGSTNPDTPAVLTPSNGESVTLAPQILGGNGDASTLEYQWSKDNEAIQNATNPTHTIDSYTPATDDGAYSVKVTDPALPEAPINIFWQVGDGGSGGTTDGHAHTTPLASDGSLDTGSYYLNSDMSTTVTAITTVSDSVVNLCLNGHKLQGTIKCNGTLNLYDCSEDKTGEIFSNVANDNVIENVGTGEVNIFSGTVSQKGQSTETRPTTGLVFNNATGTAIKNSSTGSINIKGGTVATAGSNCGNTILNASTGTINVSGGIVDGTGDKQYSVYSIAAIRNDNDGEVNITGGKVSSHGKIGSAVYNYAGGTVNISGADTIVAHIGTPPIKGHAVLNEKTGLVNISDGKIYADGTNVLTLYNMGTGKITVTGGEVRADGTTTGTSIKLVSKDEQYKHFGITFTPNVVINPEGAMERVTDLKPTATNTTAEVTDGKAAYTLTGGYTPQPSNWLVYSDPDKKQFAENVTATLDGSTLTMSGTGLKAGDYYLAAYDRVNGCGSSNKVLKLTVKVPPLTAKLTPSVVTSLEGKHLTFSGSVSGGVAPYSYEWGQYNTIDDKNLANVNGQNWDGEKALLFELQDSTHLDGWKIGFKVTDSEGAVQEAFSTIHVGKGPGLPAPGGTIDNLVNTQDKLDEILGTGNGTLNADGSITINNDLTPKNPIVIKDNVTIDLNGNTLTGKDDVSPVISVTTPAEVTITGPGSIIGGNGTGNGNGGDAIGGTGDVTITGGASINGGNGTGTGNGGDGIDLSGSGDITVDNGSVTGGTGSTGGTGATTDSGSITVNAGGSVSGGAGTDGNGTTAGGNGGAGTSTGTGSTTVNGNVTGGNGGDNSGNGNGGNGGAGANQSGQIGGTGTITGGNGGNILEDGTGNPGTGGDAITGNGTFLNGTPTKGGNGVKANAKVETTRGAPAVTAPKQELINGAVTYAERTDNTIDKIDVTLTVAKDDTPTDKTTVDSAVTSGQEVGIYLDITLAKILTINGTVESPLPVIQATQPITITVTIPENMRGGSDYKIIRVHGGTADTIIPTKVTETTLTFETDKFSTYAIAYTPGGTSNPGYTPPPYYGNTTGGGTSAPTEQEPSLPSEGTANITANTDSKGNVTVAVSDKAISDAISKAKQNYSTDGGINLLLNVSGGSTKSNTVTVNLPKSVQESIIANSIKNTVLAVSNPRIEISLGLAAVKEIYRQANDDVSITAQKLASTSLTGDAKSAIAARPVYQLKLTAKNGKLIEQLGANFITASIPYTIQKGETLGGLIGTYVEGNKKISYITASSYDADAKLMRIATSKSAALGIAYKAPAIFKDITAHPLKDDIDFAAVRELLTNPRDSFYPDGPITRGVMITALGKLANVNVNNYKAITLTDIKADDYYAPYAQWAVQNGIISGTSFGPYTAMSRQTMAAIMESYAKAIGFKLPSVHKEIFFDDKAVIAYNATDAVKQLQMAGVMLGKNENKLDPTATATRAEFFAMLHRLTALMLDESTAQGFKQNDIGKWMYFEQGNPIKNERKIINGKAYVFDRYGITADYTQISLSNSSSAIGDKADYTVKSGDSFWSIAKEHNVNINALATANKMTISSTIYPGDTLTIPR